MSLIGTPRRLVELRNGPADGKRVDAIEGVGTICIPVLAADGFRVVSYVPSRLHTADGLEIWIEQEDPPPVH